MRTPFDAVLEEIKAAGFHNHRREGHSDTVSSGLLNDLSARCEALRTDIESGRVRHWLNVRAPGARERKIDLLVAEPSPDGTPDLSRVRICLENKSVITAHRNRDARFDDLNEALQVLHRVQAQAVLLATVMIGVAERVLNVPDRIKATFKDREREFDEKILPRLRAGDVTLWEDFAWAISKNRPGDPRKTVEKFRQLATRQPAHTHLIGYDYVLLVPVFIDNVSGPSLPRPNALGIDVDAEYDLMLTQACKAYAARWHI